MAVLFRKQPPSISRNEAPFLQTATSHSPYFKWTTRKVTGWGWIAGFIYFRSRAHWGLETNLFWVWSLMKLQLCFFGAWLANVSSTDTKQVLVTALVYISLIVLLSRQGRLDCRQSSHKMFTLHFTHWHTSVLKREECSLQNKFNLTLFLKDEWQFLLIWMATHAEEQAMLSDDEKPGEKGWRNE